jgi:hypothetical protein
MRKVFVLLVAALAQAACGSAAAADPLTGTTWQLVSIDSMAPAE